MQGHPSLMGHSEEFLQNVFPWGRKWQLAAVFLPPEPREKSHALQYTKLHCGGPKCRLAFPIISYGITELYLKGSVLTSGDLRAFGQTEAMRTREEERW